MICFSVLSSGSKANCIYVQAGETQILFDCGLSPREACRRLSTLGISPEGLSAIIVSHEHSDHIRGIPGLVSRYNLKVLLNRETQENADSLKNLNKERVEYFQTGESIILGDLTIETFPISHDAADPVAFHLSCGGVHMGIVTDLGEVTAIVRQRIQNLDALILETNHDLELLELSAYPRVLKQRIRGKFGHLSNDTAGELLGELSRAQHRKPKVVVAAHVSENTNHPGRVMSMLQGSWVGELSRPEFIVASAFAATPLFQVTQQIDRAVSNL